MRGKKKKERDREREREREKERGGKRKKNKERRKDKGKTENHFQLLNWMPLRKANRCFGTFTYFEKRLLDLIGPKEHRARKTKLSPPEN